MEPISHFLLQRFRVATYAVCGNFYGKFRHLFWTVEKIKLKKEKDADIAFPKKHKRNWIQTWIIRVQDETVDHQTANTTTTASVSGKWGTKFFQTKFLLMNRLDSAPICTSNVDFLLVFNAYLTHHVGT